MAVLEALPMNKRLNKCLNNQEHDMRISSDQRDVGTRGVRYQCAVCNRMMVEYDPELHFKIDNKVGRP